MLALPVATGYCELHASCATLAAPETAFYSIVFVGIVTCVTGALLSSAYWLLQSLNYRRIVRRQRSTIILPNGKQL